MKMKNPVSTLLICSVFFFLTFFSCRQEEGTKKGSIAKILAKSDKEENAAAQAEEIRSDKVENTVSPPEKKRMKDGLMVKPAKAIPPLSPDTPEPLNLRELYASISQAEQVYEIHPEKDTVLTARQGTKISIPSGIWQTASGKPVEGNVQISVKEFYRKSDMLLANLSTSSNGMMLETGGMLYVEATAGGEKLEVAEGKAFSVEMPAENYREDMQLFYGHEEGNENHINWVLEGGQHKTGPIEKSVSSINFKKRLDATGATVQYSFAYVNPEYRKPMVIDRYISIEFEKLRKENKILISSGSVFVNKSGEITRIVFNDSTENTGDKRLSLHSVRNKEFLKSASESLFIKGKEYSLSYYYNDNLITEFDISESYVSDILKLAKKNKMVELIFEIEGTEDLFFPENSLKEKIQEGTANSYDVQNYVFSITRTGWINCDRFYKVPDFLKRDFQVQTNVADASTSIVFNNINSVMQGENSNTGIIFRNLPINKDITIVSIKTGDGKIFLALKESNTGKLKEEELVYEEVSPEELKERFSRLN